MNFNTRTWILALIFLSTVWTTVHATAIKVGYGYFAEARPVHAACGQGFFDFRTSSNVTYEVTCYPQASGTYAASRLDNGQLQLAQLGSTPMAQAVARGVDVEAIYISHYMGDSQGIYVRPPGILTPFNLKGKTIGVPFGSTMHYQVLFLLDLLELTGSVTLLNLSPSQIIEAWDSKEIDAGAIWGKPREHILDNGGQTLLTAMDLANWGRPTFVVIAVDRKFSREHSDFVTHFVAVMSRINDSFLDRLGIKDSRNILRWGAKNQPSGVTNSFMPSLVDALMIPSETFQSPSQGMIDFQRGILELYRQLDASIQLSCDYIGIGPDDGCVGEDMLPVKTLKDTAEFLLDQKVIASLGPLDDISGPVGFNGAFLAMAQRECTSCYRVGSYEATTSGELLLSELERLNGVNLRSQYASAEVGRRGGDSTCQPGAILSGPAQGSVVEPLQGSFGDGANVVSGKRYSDNLECTWEIRSPDCEDPEKDACEQFVQLRPIALRLWSEDYVRIYSDPVNNVCQPGAPSNVLEAQLTGFYDDISSLPAFRAKGCLLVELQTDGNQEKWYGESGSGDGFLMAYDRNVPGCGGPSDCSGHTCNGLTGFCECGATAFGADCSHEDFCLGTNRLVLHPGKREIIKSSESITSIQDDASEKPYKNDLNCTWDISVPSGDDVKVTIFYDLEPTHDLLHLQRGALSFEQPPSAYTVLTGKQVEGEVYFIPSDGYAVSMRFTTDPRGRRQGFHATLETVAKNDLYEPRAPCSVPGQSGSQCEVAHCVAQNQFQEDLQSSDISSSYVLGRVVSQVEGLRVQPTPWEPAGGCVWSVSDKSSRMRKPTVAIRFVFNLPLDLEPKFPSSRGDQLLLSAAGGTTTSFYVEKCQTDEDCSYFWQTGQCENRGCTVKPAVEVEVDNASGSSIRLVTDRSDGGKIYRGLDFDALLVAECPNNAGLEHCESPGSNGVCKSGLCICPDGIPCSCPCDGDAPKSSPVNVGLAVGIVLPIFIVMIGVFLVYRHRKIMASREQKRIIAEKEAELEAFKDSIVGICVAVREYVPHVVDKNKKGRAMSKTRSLRVSYTKDPPKAVWCWQETDHQMGNHGPASIFGDEKDCWIIYDNKSAALLEKAYNTGSAKCRPIDGYEVDLKTMIQTKEATGFTRKVQRVLTGKPADTKDLDLSQAHFSDGLPAELAGEPQVVLIKDDLVQISKKRDDGWAFGTKMYHADEAAARELVKVASQDAPNPDDANILVDTGWFQEEATSLPTKDQLQLLQSKVGGASALDAPEYWTQVNDPTVAERTTLKIDSSEAAAVVDSFMRTLVPPRFNKVKVISVERIQNLAMWQSYVVKRQTICYRENEMKDGNASEDAQRRAQQRAERRWLWHGTNVEVMEKIMQQGFNRSFCGKNATMYGKGVYFARDTSYSACRAYAVPDKNNYQYIMGCRVVVGEYCKGVQDALTPNVRDTKTSTLYDCTVDDEVNPGIYVTYHDAQAYPEYLIKFKLN